MFTTCIMLAKIKIKVHGGEGSDFPMTLIVILGALIVIGLFRVLVWFVSNRIRQAKLSHLTHAAEDLGASVSTASDGCHCLFCNGDRDVRCREIYMNNYRSGCEGWQVVRMKIPCCLSCEARISREKHQRNVRWISTVAGLYFGVAVVVMMVLDDAMRVACGIMLFFVGVILAVFMTVFAKKMSPTERSGVLRHPDVLRLLRAGCMFGKGPTGQKR